MLHISVSQEDYQFNEHVLLLLLCICIYSQKKSDIQVSSSSPFYQLFEIRL